MAHKRGAEEFAVIGLGQFGVSLALSLKQRGYAVTGVDRSPAVAQRFAQHLAHIAVFDATDEVALQEIAIDSYDTVVVAIGRDFESNVITTTALKRMGVPRIICKALTERHRDILVQLGADEVVLPEHEVGQRLAWLLTEPGDSVAVPPASAVSQGVVLPFSQGRGLFTRDRSQRRSTG